MSMPVILPPDRNALVCCLTRVGATPWRRRSERSAASLAAMALPRTLLPRLSLPSQMYWDSFLLAVAVTAMIQSSPSGLIDRDAVDFFQTRQACAHFFQAGAAQIPNAVFGGLIGDVHCTAAFHDDAPDRFGDRHDLVDAHAALVAVGA